MFQMLDKVQQGLLEPSVFSAFEYTKRVSSLELSVHRDIEPVYKAGINCLDIDSSEGHYMLSGSSDGSIFIHSLCNKTKLANYVCKAVCKINKPEHHSHTRSVECVQWHPHDNGLFTSTGMDGVLKVWSTNLLLPAEVFRLGANIYQHHMSGFINLIAVARARRGVALIDIRVGSDVHVLAAHSNSVMSCQWSPKDEFLLATGGQDKRLILWDVRSSKSILACLDKYNGNVMPDGLQIAHDGFVNGLVFSPDGRHLVSLGTDNRVRLWDILTAKSLGVNYGTIYNKDKRRVQICTSINSSPSVIFVPSDGKIFSYDMLSGEVINALSGHYGSVRCCVVHPYLPELYSGGSDRAVLAWEYNSRTVRGAADHKVLGRSSLTFADLPRTEVHESPFTNEMDNWSDDESVV